MAAPQIVPLPPDFELSAGYTIRLTAVSPTDNSTVSGVTISGVSIDANPVVAATSNELAVPSPLLIPEAA